MWTLAKMKASPFPQFYNAGVSEEKYMCSQLRWLQKYMRLVKEGKWLYGRK